MSRPPRTLLLRLFKAFWQPSGAITFCPDEPRLDGKRILVTGGNAGIGLETALGLARRGAEVVILARNRSKAEAAMARISAVSEAGVHFIPLDLSDLESVGRAVDEIGRQWPGRPVDAVIANAGIWPTRYSASAQGFETAFAVNVLGHHVLIRRLINHTRLADDARIVMLTGDIYILARDCTPDFRYKGALGGQLAYCRSKLGNLWWVREFSRRYEKWPAFAVHPGVVASNLGGDLGGFVHRLKKALFISTEAGAQTSLFCAIQPGLTSGAYYHNMMGRIEFHPGDPAADSGKAAAFWELLEGLATKYI
ncbi:MAG: SDR family NAD(P)-dependent oxidoreductase [Thermodesulfobacteriota bacterium]